MGERNRRRFIQEIFAASISASGFGGFASSAAGQSHEGLAELCVIARQPGTWPNDLIDVWTGQIGIIDLSRLPQHLGRVVVWDDIRGNKALSREMARILFAIEQHFGIECDLGSNTSAHVVPSLGLSVSIDKVLHNLTTRNRDVPERRIAVIDLSSCGLTRLRWADIIPSLRRCYTHIIGVEFSTPEWCELDASCEPPHGLSHIALETLQACDYWLLASDESLSGRIDLSIAERSLEFTKAIAALCDHIAVQTNIETAIGTIAQRQFATFGVRS